MSDLTIRLVLAEDQALLNNALSALLNLEPDIEVIATAQDGKSALQCVQEMAPDILLTDIEMPELSGLDVAAELKQLNLNTKVIIVTTFGRSGYLRRAMDLGVKGFLLKESSTDELASAIRRVHQGRKVIDPELITDAWDSENPLTDKERKALSLAKDGLSTEQIADRLHLSSGTVRNYLSQAASKLSASNRIEAARIAHQKGWL
ncbi:response regulator transcription factor [Pleionea litopenaei]|uniref:Response regulator transcription factor n=1 Tax=Pleionea litopenaei TaxID=3070815 RepID=A0AA51RRJ7_9GAMM|nr:response regulator transcription factor [Pleionea sp. HL-JVS1]WMS86295.1 response regulator transcription factor [Pleionea sp. HL-JVS1]